MSVTRFGGVRCKTFQWSDLRDAPQSIANRCALIEHLTVNRGLFPRTWHERTADSLIQYQDRIVGRLPLTVALDAVSFPLRRLAESLDKMSESGFVHGDISIMNIVWDGHQLHLVDFEPSLRQRVRGIKVVKSPIELRASRDAAEQRVSVRSDRTAFFILCAGFGGAKVGRSLPGEFDLTLRGAQSRTVLEDEVTSLTFPQILERVTSFV